MEAYWRLPVFVQNLALSAYGRRLDRLYYGGEFARSLEAIRARRWDSAREIEIWQMEQLRRILASAAAHVPHYRRLGPPDASSFQVVADLERLPVLERQAVRQHE